MNYICMCEFSIELYNCYLIMRCSLMIVNDII